MHIQLKVAYDYTDPWVPTFYFNSKATANSHSGPCSATVTASQLVPYVLVLPTARRQIREQLGSPPDRAPAGGRRLNPLFSPTAAWSAGRRRLALTRPG